MSEIALAPALVSLGYPHPQDMDAALDEAEFDRAAYPAAVTAPAVDGLSRVLLGMDRREDRDESEFERSGWVWATRDARGRVVAGVRRSPPKPERIVFEESDGAHSQIWSADPVGGSKIRLSSAGSNERLIYVQDGVAYWRSDRLGGAVGGYCSPIAEARERPVLPIRAVAMYGDSMTEGLGAAAPASKFGVPVYNFGVSSNTSKAVAARQGGARLSYEPVGGVIPASGVVTLSPADPGPVEKFINQAASIAAIWCGREGVLSWSGDPNGVLTFALSGSGPVIINPGRQPVVVQDVTTAGFAGTTVPHVRQMIQRFAAGRNDIQRGDYSLETIIARDAACVAALEAQSARFYFMPVLNGADETFGTEAYRRVLEINAFRRAAYPANYCEIDGVDARQHLVRVGAGGGPSDQVAYLADIPPPSLRGDNLHLNNAGNDILLDFEKAFLTLKGWI